MSNEDSVVAREADYGKMGEGQGGGWDRGVQQLEAGLMKAQDLVLWHATQRVKL